HNMAYRWFLGFGITTKIPDHSIFSQNRIRRFTDSTLFEDIFYEILKQADQYGLIKGKIVYTDSTHIRADASNSKYSSVEEEKLTGRNNDLERINTIRERHGHKPLKSKEDKLETKRKKVSTTDPDSGYMNRDRKPEGFYYLDHRTVDSSYNIILDTYVSAGNVHDATPYLERIDHVREVVKSLPNTQEIKYTCADAGYFNNKVLLGLKERHLTPIIGAVRHHKKPGKDSKYWFTYDLIEDVYVCKAGQLLEYQTTTREGYSSYESDPEVCRSCEHKEQCIFDGATKRTLRRHIYEEYKDEARELLKTEKGKALYARRKETVERSFADSKTHHGYRYARYRGCDKVQSQAYLVATIQNIKKMALVLDGLGVK
ncbi:IS1182 family transposase, partial [Fusibacter sp. A2]